MGRRRDSSLVGMLLESLEFVFQYIPPWVSIPVGVVGGLLIVYFSSTFKTELKIFNMLGWIIGGAFTLIFWAAGLKAWLGHRSQSPDSFQSGVTSSEPTCPSCGRPMVLRHARRGSNAGNGFWGCSGYPNCRGTRNIS